jgi:hypothetical protein
MGIETEEIVRRAPVRPSRVSSYPSTGTLYETLGREALTRQQGGDPPAVGPRPSSATTRDRPGAGGPEWLRSPRRDGSSEAYRRSANPVRRRRYDLELVPPAQAWRPAPVSGPPPARRLSPVWSGRPDRVGGPPAPGGAGQPWSGSCSSAPLSPVSLHRRFPFRRRLVSFHRRVEKEPSAPIPGPPSCAGTRSPGSTRAPDGRDRRVGCPPGDHRAERPAEPFRARAPNALAVGRRFRPDPRRTWASPPAPMAARASASGGRPTTRRLAE